MHHRLQVISNHLVSKPLQYLLSSSTTQQQQQQSSSSVSSSVSSPVSPPPMIQIHPSVQQSLNKYGNGRGMNNIVALESTIITHGMPYPHNVQTARRVEAVIREHGAIPATIAILDGIIHVGLSDDEMDRLSQLGEQHLVKKCSRRDLSCIVANREHGATTVSATMMIAHMVGISLFVTGGIGGVHRGVSDTMDISADLTELGRTSTTVISAGVKSILDIEKTLEYLETMGVTVATYQTNEFPAFFTRHSGLESPMRVESVQQVAQMIKSSAQLGVESGMLLAVPIPANEEANNAPIHAAVERALSEAHEQGIQGKNVTPFLLKRVNELTGGESLRANIALILNNARVGAQIARALISQSSTTTRTTTTTTNHKNSQQQQHIIPNVICIGGCVLDISASPKSGTRLLSHTSNPGKVKVSFGGVARNCLELLSRQLQMKNQVHFVSALQNDSFGTLLTNHLLHDLQLNHSSVALFHPMNHNNTNNNTNKNNNNTNNNNNSDNSSSNDLDNTSRTAVYNCMIDETGEMVTAVADMDILERELSPERISDYLSALVKQLNNSELWNSNNNNKNSAPIVLFVDGNVSSATLKTICHFVAQHNNNKNNNRKFSVFFEPTSVAKCVKPIEVNCLSLITYMKPNEDELYAMASALLSSSISPNNLSIYDCMKLLVQHGANHIFLTRGKYGVVHAYRNRNKITFDHYSAIPVSAHKRVNVTGCGDNFASGLTYGIAHGFSISNSIHMGLRASFLTLQCEQSVHPKLSVKFITTKQPEEDFEENEELMDDPHYDPTQHSSFSEDL